VQSWNGLPSQDVAGYRFINRSGGGRCILRKRGMTMILSTCSFFISSRISVRAGCWYRIPSRTRKFFPRRSETCFSRAIPYTFKGEPSGSHTFLYTAADLGARKGAMIPFTNKALGINGISITLPSIRNCRRYFRTSPVEGESGVPRFARITPVFILVQDSEFQPLCRGKVLRVSGITPQNFVYSLFFRNKFLCLMFAA
jgi:hypothetical protein